MHDAIDGILGVFKSLACQISFSVRIVRCMNKAYKDLHLDLPIRSERIRLEPTFVRILLYALNNFFHAFRPCIQLGSRFVLVAVEFTHFS
jgi:hypothetical protein